MSLFADEIEQEAIARIQKFARIAKAMELPISVGFSGGKDSQVTLHLCQRAGIEFTAYFNHSLESPTTLKFIREHYPNVIWRRDVKEGLIQHIKEVRQGYLPTVQSAYCCKTYKHNPKYVDKCVILGTRRAESAKRAKRTVFTAKNKTTLKRIKAEVNEYFKEQCQSIGSGNIITLHPIVEWSDKEVWDYIHRYELPINPEYEYSSRVGCLICPKANFTRNYHNLMKYPKLIDAVIKARNHPKCAWGIPSDNKDYSDNKIYYVCRWLNHSFMPFTKKQEELYRQVEENYYKMKNQDGNKEIHNMKRPKYRCSDCIHWEAKGQWHSTHHPHFAVIAEGICMNTNKTKLNCHYQCTNDFELKTIRGQVQVWNGK